MRASPFVAACDPPEVKAGRRVARKTERKSLTSLGVKPVWSTTERSSQDGLKMSYKQALEAQRGRYTESSFDPYILSFGGLLPPYTPTRPIYAKAMRYVWGD